MLFPLKEIPLRTASPRRTGLTMINDRGMSLQEARNLMSVGSPYVDMVKLAFGTPMLTADLKEKIRVFQDAGVTVFFGGLLFEAFLVRNQLEDYIRIMSDYQISHVEISDGSIDLTHEAKCGFIERMAKTATVFSEIGSKDKDKQHITPPYKWVQMMKAELSAGAAYLIAEGREAGTVGIFRDDGEVREGLVQEIINLVDPARIIWETPQKEQQLYFIKLLGANANLGNVNPNEIIALETMRIGLRGDSLHFYVKQAPRPSL